MSLGIFLFMPHFMPQCNSVLLYGTPWGSIEFLQRFASLSSWNGSILVVSEILLVIVKGYIRSNVYVDVYIYNVGFFMGLLVQGNLKLI